MNKIICDVCGTDYPETVSQCPICGCANVGSGQTSAGNTVGESDSGYTYTKGGRFSKANVRKRNKSNGATPVIAPRPAHQPENPAEEDNSFDDEEFEGVTNKGLIFIVVILLVAIIAVSAYIVVTFFGDKDPKDPSEQTSSSELSDSPTDGSGESDPTDPSGNDSSDPSGTEPIENRIPCTGLSLVMDSMTLQSNNAMRIEYSVEPKNTTDKVTFKCTNESIVKVNAQGYVTPVSRGETTIVITCGDKTAVISVHNLVDGGAPNDPSAPTDPTGSGDPTLPDHSTEPTTGVKLELNTYDFSLFFVGDKWNIYRGSIDRTQITWSSDNEAVVTVENGLVVAVGPGSTKVWAEYEGQRVSCKVYCQFQAEQPTEPPTEVTDPSEEVTEPSEDVTNPSEDVTESTEDVTDPSEEVTDPTEEATDPTEEVTDPSEDVTEPSIEETEPVVERKLLVNGATPYAGYRDMDKDHSADLTLDWRNGVNPEYCRLTITNTENVQWTSTNESVCIVEVRDASNVRIVPVGQGTAFVKATVDGVEYIIWVHI